MGELIVHTAVYLNAYQTSNYLAVKTILLIKLQYTTR